MRRIGRYILNGLTVLSLVLCVAVAGLWARSHRDPKVGLWRTHDGSYEEIYVEDGGLWFGSDRINGDPDYQIEHRWTAFPTAAAIDRTVDAHRFPQVTWHYFESTENDPRGRLGFGRRIRQHNYRTVRLYAVPLWLPAMALGSPLAAMVSWQFRRSRRRGMIGKCAYCGYDLRATPDRCPECGTIPTKVKA